jgi:cupin superfamily acireductone dioxygenase involved in methionine salvage
MSFISQTKFQNLNEQRKQTSRSISQCISQLNAHASTALKQQAYLRKNPDLNIDPEFITIMGAEVAPIAAAFAEVQYKLNDIVSVMTEEMTVDDMMEKYNIDLSQVSSELL